jgi:hypothetical protein
MHRPVFGASTLKEENVYRIDYETSEDEADAETARMSLPSPAAASVVPVPSSRAHSFAATLPLSSRR